MHCGYVSLGKPPADEQEIFMDAQVLIALLVLSRGKGTRQLPPAWPVLHPGCKAGDADAANAAERL